MERIWKRIHIYILYLNHFAVHQKLIQHCNKLYFNFEKVITFYKGHRAGAGRENGDWESGMWKKPLFTIYFYFIWIFSQVYVLKDIYLRGENPGK